MTGIHRLRDVMSKALTRMSVYEAYRSDCLSKKESIRALTEIGDTEESARNFVAFANNHKTPRKED